MKSSAIVNELMSLLYESLMRVSPCLPSFTSRRMPTGSRSGILSAICSGVRPSWKAVTAQVIELSIDALLMKGIAYEPLMISNVGSSPSSTATGFLYSYVITLCSSPFSTEETKKRTSLSVFDQLIISPPICAAAKPRRITRSSALHTTFLASSKSDIFSVHFCWSEGKCS